MHLDAAVTQPALQLFDVQRETARQIAELLLLERPALPRREPQVNLAPQPRHRDLVVRLAVLPVQQRAPNLVEDILRDVLLDPVLRRHMLVLFPIDECDTRQYTLAKIR